MWSKKMMAEQLDMFAPRPEPKRKKTKVVQVKCPHHAVSYICPDCPGDIDTDGYGFVHPSRCRDLIPVRVCPRCSMPVTREHWDNERGACNYEGCCGTR